MPKVFSMGAGCVLGLCTQILVTSVQADPVLDWTALALDCFRTDNSSPTLSTRSLAILHTAMYDAVNSIARTHQPYRFQLDPPAGTSAEAAAVGAAAEVMLDLYPSLESWTLTFTTTGSLRPRTTAP